MDDRLPRKLAAILYADVAGYSRLTALDEDATHRDLTKSLDLISEQVSAHRGRVGHYAGDAVLADFSSASDALACACQIQRALKERHAALPEDRQLQFRVGLNLGEVIDDRGEVYGDGVNIAARLESLAEPGGICASDAIRAAVGNRLAVHFEDLGECTVKNIPAPVRAWRVQTSSSDETKVETVLLRAEVRAYGILMSEHVDATRDALDRARAILIDAIERHGGQLLAVPGDGLLVRFANVEESVSCAVQARKELEEANALIPPQDRVHYRYGIDVGRLALGTNGPAGGVVDRTAALCASAPPSDIRVSKAAHAKLPAEIELTLSAVSNDVYAIDHLPGNRLETSTLPPQLASLELPLPEKPSIVLLPFTSLGDDAQAEALAEGLRLDIQNALVKMSGLFLIAAGAANAMRGTPSPDAARALGVRHVLEGRLRRSGNRARISVQLTDSTEGTIRWSEQYDRNLDDEFALQDEITERIVTALDVELASGEQARIWRKCLNDSKARELFYRGMTEFFRMNAESMAKAKSNFTRVFDMVPSSPLGATWCAMCLWFQATRGWSNDPAQVRIEAGEWAERAVLLEDADGQAHTVLGNVRLLQRRFDEALEVARRAVLIRPGCTNANGFLANVLLHCGHPRDALVHVKQAIRLSPVYPPWFLEILAASYREAGQLGPAIDVAQELLRLAPQSVQGRLILLSALVRGGWTAEAKRVAGEILASDDAFSTRRYAEQQVFREQSVVERLVSDLVRVGLPE